MDDNVEFQYRSEGFNAVFASINSKDIFNFIMPARVCYGDTGAAAFSCMFSTRMVGKMLVAEKKVDENIHTRRRVGSLRQVSRQLPWTIITV